MQMNRRYSLLAPEEKQLIDALIDEILSYRELPDNVVPLPPPPNKLPVVRAK